jgi:hypothetical protein
LQRLQLRMEAYLSERAIILDQQSPCLLVGRQSPRDRLVRETQ